MRHLYQACTAAGPLPTLIAKGSVQHQSALECRVNPHSVTLLTGLGGLVAQPGVTRIRIYTVAFPH